MNVWILIEYNIVRYKPNLPKTFDTKNPADINPNEKKAAIIPIVLSEQLLCFNKITIKVKKYHVQEKLNMLKPLKL